MTVHPNEPLDTPQSRTLIPHGYVPLANADAGPFSLHCGPLYIFEVDLQPVRLGFMVEGHHLNPMGSCHGGMLVTFCDMLMPIVAQRTHPDLRGSQLPSMNLQVDFLSAVREGDWVEGEVEVLRATRSIVVAQCLVRTAAGLIARASGTFKVVERGPLYRTGKLG